VRKLSKSDECIMINNDICGESCLLLVGFLRQSTQDIVEDTAILEILNLDIGVQPHLDLERFASAGGYLQLFRHLQVALSDINVESLLSCQT